MRQFEKEAQGPFVLQRLPQGAGEEHRLQSWLCNRQAADLSFLICKVGIRTAPTSAGCSVVEVTLFIEVLRTEAGTKSVTQELTALLPITRITNT